MQRSQDPLYRFPWSQTDNPGGWVEVTDDCDLQCRGCYRHRLEGHRPLEEIKSEILAHKRLRNCDRIAIAGGEPLLYPDIVEVVDYITRQGMKPMILTNGWSLSWDKAMALKEAGLTQFYFHVDSGQNRPGWEGKDESQLNEVRQYFADICWELHGVQCGFNTTVFRSTLSYIPDIVRWCRANVPRVQHLSLIAYRALPVVEGTEYLVSGKRIDPLSFGTISTKPEMIDISTDEMQAIVQREFPGFRACAYLNGTTAQRTRKFVVMLSLGSEHGVFGSVGGKTVEVDQIVHHMLHGRYSASIANPRVGKKVFLLSVIDRELRAALRNYLKSCIRNPLRLFDSMYVQAVNLQQPNEIVDGAMNLCEGCVNMMLYKGEWINSCRLDEYRILGGPISAVVRGRDSKEFPVDPVPLAHRPAEALHFSTHPEV